MEFQGGAVGWQVSGNIGGPARFSHTASRRKRAISAAVAGVLGLIFLGSGFIVKNSGVALKDGVLINGQVVATPCSGSDDDDTCTKVVRYVVNGAAYQARSSVGTSSNCGAIGQTMQVSYLSSDPQTARVIDSTAKNGGRFFQALGGFLLVLCVLLVVDAVMGLTMADVATTGERLVGGPSVSLSDLASTNLPPSAGPLGSTTVGPPPLPPPARAPSPGWYLDPDHEAVQRWWDGREWTEHRHESSSWPPEPSSPSSRSHDEGYR